LRSDRYLIRIIMNPIAKTSETANRNDSSICHSLPFPTLYRTQYPLHLQTCVSFLLEKCEKYIKALDAKIL
jgi:hypothetical protein